MLKLNSKVLEFELDEVIHRVKFPSVLRLAKFRDDAEKLVNLQLSIELLVELGLNREVAENLELSAFNAIIDGLMGDGKK